MLKSIRTALSGSASPFSSRSFALATGEYRTTASNLRPASLPAGVVQVTATGPSGFATVSAAYAAKGC